MDPVQYDDDYEDPYVIPPQRSRHEEQIALEEQAYEEEQLVFEQKMALEEQQYERRRVREAYCQRHGYY